MLLYRELLSEASAFAQAFVRRSTGYASLATVFRVRDNGNVELVFVHDVVRQQHGAQPLIRRT